MELSGATVVVTGGVGGIGRAIAHVAKREGALVAVADIQEPAEGDEFSRDWDLFVHADVSSEEDVDALMSKVVSTFGRLDGFVNNAATIAFGSVAEASLASWRKVIDVNLTGVFLGCRAAVRQYLKQETPGSIVNIGSIAALVSRPEQPAYCASKGGILQLTRQVAADYARKGIRCNSVGPGSVEGAFLRDYIDGQPDPAATEAAIASAHPIGRLAAASEVAEVVAFLLSDRASFITGANVQVDGGYSIV